MKKRATVLLLVCVSVLSFALVGCGNAAPAEDAASTGSAAVATESSQASDANAASTADAVAGTSVSASDLANVDIVIEYGDYDAMKDLSANIQNARAEGSVVQVDGLVVNYGTSYGIVEPNEDNTKRIGTVFTIEGAAADAYPQDGQRVKITGIIGSDETGYTSFVKTLPEFVEVVG